VSSDEKTEPEQKEKSKLPIDFGGFGRALSKLLKSGATYSGSGPKKLRGRGYTKPFNERKKKKLKAIQDKKVVKLASRRGLRKRKSDKRHR
jgi:hypothetical protein